MKLLAVITLLASLGLSLDSEAVAQNSGDRAAAQALFDEGQRLMKAEKFAEACAKFEASVGLAPGLGSRGRLAQCYEKIGKTASAWAAFRQVADLAKMQKDDKRYAAANRLAKELEKRLSYVTFTRKEPTPGMKIYRDGATLSLGVLGTPIAIDPGEHTLEARADGFETWTHSFSVGAKSNSSIEIPALVKNPEVPKPALSMRPNATSVDNDATVSAQAVRPSKSSTKMVGMIVAGSGGALVGSAVVLAILGDQKWNGAFDDGDCNVDTNGCNAAGQKATDSARTLSKVSLVVGTVGLVAAATGTYLWIRGRSQEDQRGVSIAPTASASGVGLAISGSY
tara:strand:- start:78574 stop:79590 length:1017 start_codon:yes stop_codon:yes gene_type:complete